MLRVVSTIATRGERRSRGELIDEQSSRAEHRTLISDRTASSHDHTRRRHSAVQTAATLTSLSKSE